MAGTPVKRATEQADTTWSSAEDSHQSGFASSTKRSGMGKWEAKLTTMAEESVRALQTRADRTSAKTTSAQPTDAKHQGASKVTRTAGVRWCREGDLNPHNPFGSADFKFSLDVSKYHGKLLRVMRLSPKQLNGNPATLLSRIDMAQCTV
jgi:hypothetical protein